MGIVFERPLIQANKRSGDHTRSSSYQSPVLDHKHFVTTSLHDIVEDLITSAVHVSYQVTLGRKQKGMEKNRPLGLSVVSCLFTMPPGSVTREL